MDWAASFVLVLGYVLLARHARWAALIIFFSDVLWVTYAILTGQVPLGLVSAFCGVFSLRAFLAWSDVSRLEA